MLILLVILKIILLNLAVDYNQLFIYQKILAYQQAKYTEHAELNKQLQQLMTKEFNPQDSIGLIANQLYVYPIIINNHRYGYLGQRPGEVGSTIVLSFCGETPNN